ncbi:DeoR family transcriptional regulator, partial [Enterococcus faecium]|uniref:DeoR family transcriptional regulator n=1 Tax=Enterococcus faecium TaxID=1352 RepID=UPI00397732B7
MSLLLLALLVVPHAVRVINAAVDNNTTFNLVDFILFTYPIRRDLKDLDSQGLLKRVHSGALRVGPPITNFNYRETVASEQK